ncbi:MAG: hypothetical protein ACT4OP_06810 [Actinomycetota bacterium]
MALLLLASLVAVAAAVRSTWSPCGLSMLSTITPLSESGRGRQFHRPAVWYVIGSVLGGATLGGVVAILTSLLSGWAVTESMALAVVTGASLIAAISDGRVLGAALPGHQRQVNERWLDTYRPWVYGVGFGWQIGVGLGTYIITSGVYLMIVMGLLTFKPMAALGLGVGFGLVRGLMIYLSAGLTTPERLLTFHASFEGWREVVRQSMIGIEVLTAVVAAAVAGADRLVVLTVAGAGLVIMYLSVRGEAEVVRLHGARAAGAPS